MEASIDCDGWSDAAIRGFARINRPYLKVDVSSSRGSKPPENKEGTRWQEMVSLDVKYPGADNHVQIPDDFLLISVREFRKNLECGIYLEKELGGYGLHQLCPIEPDPDMQQDSYERTHGISRILLHANLLKRLIEKDLPLNGNA